MDLSNFIPRECHPSLRWLGDIKKNWFSIIRMPGHRTSVTIDFKVLNTLGYQDHKRYLRVFLENNNYNYFYWGLFFAKTLSDGPKIFRPTVEQFDSMCNVELQIPISTYVQPYPSMVVEVPNEIKKSLCQELGITISDMAKYVLITRIETNNGICVFAGQPYAGGVDENFQVDNADMFHLFHDRPEISSIEEAITTRINPYGNPNHYLYSETILRASLNLMLMLMHFGHKDGGPLHPNEYQKHRRKCKTKNKEKQNVMALGDFRSVDMIQDIIIRQEKHYPSSEEEESSGSGKEISPHWRRGHWRFQRYGEKLSSRKMILIKPVLVRSDRVLGHIGDSQAIYRLKNN